MMPTTSAAGTLAHGPIPGRPVGLLANLAAPAPDTDRLRRDLGALPEHAVPGLLEAISWHRIDGLAHRALLAAGRDCTSGWLSGSLRRRARRCAAATLAQGLALAEILEALDRASIPAAVMRGLRTIESVYGDPSLRPFEDHDLLVLPGDFDAAGAAIRRLGFDQPAAGYFRRGGVFVDLHADPLGARRRPTRAAVFSLPAAAILGRAAPGRVAGSPALLADAEDDFILLAVHLVKHSFDRLVRTADVAHVLAHRSARLRWDVLIDRAAASRTLPLLCRAAEAAAALGVAVPEPLREARPPRAVAWLMRRVTRLRPLPYTGEMLMLLSAPGAGARLRFLIDAVVPAGESPAGAWRRTALFPRRAVAVARGALRQIGERRTGR
jgi:hypothetical protein